MVRKVNMRIIKITKYIVALLISVVIAVGGYATYIGLPTGTDIELSKAPKQRLKEILATVDSEQVINSDIYASSTYQPNDPLYKAVVEIQSKDWSKAVESLTPLVEQGNIDAMYWLGEITYSSSAFSDGGKWFLKSASLGNPYAAMKLSPQYNISNDCELWLRGYCDYKWGDEGLKAFKNLADNGDIKAAYAYLFYTRFENTGSDYFEQLIEITKEGINRNYYRPLRHLVYMYQTRESPNPFSHDVIPLTLEDKRQLVKLLMVAVNNNDVFSMNLVKTSFYQVLESPEVLNEAIERTKLNYNIQNNLSPHETQSSFDKDKIKNSPITFIDEIGGAREYYKGGFE